MSVTTKQGVERVEAGASGGSVDGDRGVVVVISISERPEGVEAVYEESREAFREAGYMPRFVLSAEPWARAYLEPFRARRDRGEPVRLLMAGQTVGETALVQSAVAVSPAEIVVTMPGYHRVDPAVLPELVERVRDGADMAVARRWPRKDSATNRLQTRLFHGLVRGLTGSQLNDVACGVRAMKPSVLTDIPVYGDFGRFLPVLAARQGYRVEELDAEQHELDRPTRVYAPGVYLRRLLDVFGLYFLSRFTEKPLRFFGLLGGGLGAGGILLLAVLTVQRLQGRSLADRPLLLLGVLLVVLGVQLIALGLVGEIIVHLHSTRRKPYRLAEVDPGASDPRPRSDSPPRNTASGGQSPPAPPRHR